jgi:hypothetical protein
VSMALHGVAQGRAPKPGRVQVLRS